MSRTAKGLGAWYIIGPGEPRSPGAATASKGHKQQSSGQAASGAQESARADYRTAWGQVYNGKLIEWGLHPEALLDEEFEPPSSEVIALAANLVRTLRDAGCPAPTRVVPDGEGGVSFERDDGRVFEEIDVLEDRTIDMLVFLDGRLVDRVTISNDDTSLAG